MVTLKLFWNFGKTISSFLKMMSLSILSRLKTSPRFNRRNLMLSSWRMGVKDLPAKNKMKFNVGGIEAETREGLVTEILKFMETEEGKKKSALWIGWGGTITLGLGELISMMIMTKI